MEAFDEINEHANNDLIIRRFLKSLSRHSHKSLLGTLKEKLDSADIYYKGRYLKAIASFSDKSEVEKFIIQSLENSINDFSDHFNEQSYIISGMISNLNQSYKKVLINHLSNGRLSEDGRQNFAYSIWRLLKDKENNLDFIFDLMKLLLCDTNVQTRYTALHII